MRIQTVLLAVVPLLGLPVQDARAQAAVQVSPRGLSEILAPPLPPAPEARDQVADVTIVVYFDYNCAACRHLDLDLFELRDGDQQVRVVHKNWPIFGGGSAYAAYSAFAAANLGHYELAHRALMSAGGPLDSRQAVDEVMQKTGLDPRAITAEIDAHRSRFSATLTRNQNEAEALGLPGTPGIIVGDQVFAGSLTLDQLRTAVARTRASQQTSSRLGPSAGRAATAHRNARLAAHSARTSPVSTTAAFPSSMRPWTRSPASR
ncbi:MAG: thioredoxin domain-containing protein [Steroidobacteraceae bacterium]